MTWQTQLRQVSKMSDLYYVVIIGKDGEEIKVDSMGYCTYLDKESAEGLAKAFGGEIRKKPDGD